LPSDVTGTEVYYQKDGKGEFRFEPGPIFANIVLGDEINRAPAKVQAAMLEAMEERQVTVAGTTHRMPPLFMVMATQNPVEQEGTYPLPEAQMDRFLMHVNIEYTPVEDEVRIVELVRAEEVATNSDDSQQAPESVERIPQQAVFDARREIGQIHVSPAIGRYMADLVYATRTPEKYSEDLARWIDVGGSPRASLALDKCSRTHAWLNGRDFVDPEDVRAIVHDCLRHRLMLSYEAQGEGVRADQVIDAIVEQVALP
jgi:MoxR-like ATPase